MTRRPLWTYDGDAPVEIAKKEVIGWLRRIREDLRNFEQCLRDLASAEPDERASVLDAMRGYAEDASGAAGEVFKIAEATIDQEGES